MNARTTLAMLTRVVLTLGLASAITLDAAAQVGTRGTNDRKKSGNTNLGGDQGAGEAGTARMIVTRYKPDTKADTKSDMIGRISLRDEKKKTVNLMVRDGFGVDLGGKRISGDELEHVLVSGMIADVTWGVDKTDPKNRKLCMELKPVVTEFDGTVDEYNAEDETVRIVAVPRDTAGWADEQFERAQNEGKSAKSNKKPGQRRKLRVKALSEGSRVIDELNRTRSMSDFEPQKRVFGKLLVGTKFSIVEELTLILPEEEKIAANAAGGADGTAAGGEGNKDSRDPKDFKATGFGGG